MTKGEYQDIKQKGEYHDIKQKCKYQNIKHSVRQDRVLSPDLFSIYTVNTS